jgi:hypothetical protein
VIGEAHNRFETAHFVHRAFYQFPSLPINNVEHCAEELTSRIVQSPARQAFRDPQEGEL